MIEGVRVYGDRGLGACTARLQEIELTRKMFEAAQVELIRRLCHPIAQQRAFL